MSMDKISLRFEKSIEDYLHYKYPHVLRVNVLAEAYGLMGGART